MLIATVGDANSALMQLYDDLTTSMQEVQAANTTTSSFFSQIGGGIDQFFGGTGDGGNTTLAASSLLAQLSSTAATIQGEISGLDPATPLTTQQIAQLSELQKDVIDDRKLVGKEISSVNWSFGGIFSDAASILENTASQAITGVSSAFGINWTLVVIAALVVGAVYLGLWKRLVT
jgi:hypothetical protein